MTVCDSLIVEDLQFAEHEDFTSASRRRLKIAQVREAVERGDYYRDAYQVAKRMVSRWIAEGRFPELEKPA